MSSLNRRRITGSPIFVLTSSKRLEELMETQKDSLVQIFQTAKAATTEEKKESTKGEFKRLMSFIKEKIPKLLEGLSNIAGVKAFFGL